MKYTGQFKDINENLYTVNIITDNDSTTTKTVTLGTTPFVTEIETSEEHLYKPVKYSSATIRMINDDYSFDLYSAEAQENKVTLVDKDNVIRWIGYTTPNLYSQGYENEVEEIEIECIDALATLQYYKYHPIKDNKKNIVSFIDIIDYLLGKCNVYTTYYISNNTQPMYIDGREGCMSSDLYISEQDFFDEDNEPMTMQEVLEEICKYLNVTCIADGTSVYFLDYDAIKNNINTYYQFTVGNTTGTLVTLSQFNEIDGSDYVENGGQISLDNVYNRVTVKDSLYSFKPVIPELFGSGLIKYMMWDFNMNVIPYQEFIIDSPQADGKYKCFWKYYNHENYKTYYYDKNTLNETIPLGIINYGVTQNYVGATIARNYNKKIKDDKEIINSIDWKDYIVIHNHAKSDSTLRPIFELNINDIPPSFISNDSYFVLKMGYSIYDIPMEMIPYEGYSRDDDDFNENNLYLTCSMECNGKWWNGQYWTNSFTTFRLEFDANGNTDHFIGKTYQVKNNISYDMGIDDSGYAIRVPSTWFDLAGVYKPKFIIYQPHNVDGGYKTYSAYISDFEITVEKPNEYAAYEEHLDDKETDTEYTNVINTNFVNELDDIEFKICTWDNKMNNYSATFMRDNLYQFNEYLDKTMNKATQQTLRQEEHLIYRLVTQYSTPSAILNLNLKNEIKPYCLLSDKWLPNKLFIVDSITTDWEYNKAEIKLIEKK